MDVSGTVTEGGLVDPAEYSTVNSADDKLELAFLHPIEDAYRVRFATDVLDGDGNLTVNNTATLFDGGESIGSDSASATVERGAMLRKSVRNNSYSAVDHSVEWEILYNFGERFIAVGDAVLIDTFGGIEQEIVGGLNESSFSVEKLSLDEGAVIGATPYTDFTISVHPDAPASSGFQLSFDHDIDSAFRIRYSTKAAHPVYGSGTMANTVKFNDRSRSKMIRRTGRSW